MKKILIICAIPLSNSSSTRALSSYFGKFNRDNLAQLYSSQNNPNEMLCSSYFQITDAGLLKSVLGKKYSGRVIEKVEEDKFDHKEKKNSKLLTWLYKIGKKEWPSVQLLRKLLWSKKRWDTSELENWIKNFNPDEVFVHNSNALFMGKTAIDISNKYNLPYSLEIADDYYFNSHFSISPFYFLYRHLYKKQFKKLIKNAKNVFYISDAMKNKYDKFFDVNGIVVRAAAQISLPIKNPEEPYKISYFGNIGLKRYKTLIRLDNFFSKNMPNVFIDVYCPIIGGNSNLKKIKRCKNINIMGCVPYKKMIEKIENTDFLLFIESFNRKIQKDIRFSLSTKIGDYLNSGRPVIAIGPKGSGSIDYLLSQSSAFVISNLQNIGDICHFLSKKDHIVELENNKKVAERDFNIWKNQELLYTILNDE